MNYSGVKREQSESTKQEFAPGQDSQKRLKVKNEFSSNDAGKYQIKSEYANQGYNLETGNSFSTFNNDDNSSLFIFKRKKGQVQQQKAENSNF